MVCGGPLDYLEQACASTCSLCGKEEAGHIRCPQGHYLCDTCHNKGVMEIIEDLALNAASDNPLEIAELMMRSPGLPMLGCQHAFIAAGALMAALRRNGTRAVSDGDIREVFLRTEQQARGGYCGLTGVCGVAPAVGACFAVLTGSKCGTDEEQRITMDAVVRVSQAIAALTGPSCCKAYVRAALTAAAGFLKERLGIALPLDGGLAVCTVSERHPHGCRMERCLYYPTKKVAGRSSDMMQNPMDRYDEFFSLVYQTGLFDQKTKHIIGLAASLGAG